MRMPVCVASQRNQLYDTLMVLMLEATPDPVPGLEATTLDLGHQRRW
jgi:hypothetical protein